MARRTPGPPGLSTAAWTLGAGSVVGVIAALAVAFARPAAIPSEIRPEPPPAVGLTAAAPPAPAPLAGLPEPVSAGKHGDDGTGSWPKSFHPTAKRPTPVAMRLEPDGTPVWPADFHPTPSHPTPLTVCLEDDGPSGGTVCPGSTEQLAIPLR